MGLGWVSDAADFYRLRPRSRSPSSRDSARCRRPSWSRRSRPRRSGPFALVLFALGIEEVGYVTGRSLAQQFRTIDALLAASARGDRADAGRRARRWRSMIHDQLADPRDARADRPAARAAGLRFEEAGPPPGEGPLAGKTLVLTGTLPNLTREEATERILAAGGSRHGLGVQGRPTTWSPVRARGRSSRRRERLGCRCSTKRVCGTCWPGSRPTVVAGHGDRHRVLQRMGGGRVDGVLEEREHELMAVRARQQADEAGDVVQRARLGVAATVGGCPDHAAGQRAGMAGHGQRSNEIRVAGHLREQPSRSGSGLRNRGARARSRPRVAGGCRAWRAAP